MLATASILLALLPWLPQSLADFEPSQGYERFRHGCPPELTQAALDQGREVDEDGYPLDWFVEGELLLVLAPGAEHAAAALHDGIGARVVDRMPARHAQRVELPRQWSVARAIRLYQRMPFVLHASRNILHSLDEVPFDPIYNDPLPGQWAYKRIGCERAWDISKGASWVKIAVIDSGVSNHDDLGDSILSGVNLVDDSANVTDNVGHGTFVAQVAAANHNQLGIAGVAPNVSILPVKISDDMFADAWRVADGIWWAIENDADVLNLSLSTSGYDMLVDWAVQDAWKANRIVVAAAGNAGSSNQAYPAANKNVLAVAFSDYLTDARAPDSNYGSWVDVAAPGVAVAASLDETFNTVGLAGSSYAAPLVSGGAALVCSVLGAGYDNDVVVARIKDNCDPVATGYTEAGRVNLREALSGVNLSTHASWPAATLLAGTYTVVGGSLESLSSTLGGDVSFDTRSVTVTLNQGGQTSYFQVVSVPMEFKPDIVTGINDVVVQLEGRASIANLPLKLQVWNNATGAYQTLSTQNLVSTTTDTQITFTISDPAPYVAANGTIRLRYRSEPWSIGAPPAPYTIEMDLARVKMMFFSQ